MTHLFHCAVQSNVLKCSGVVYRLRYMAKNRRDSEYQNMLKNKERAKAILEKIREGEAAYEAAKADVTRLQARLKDDD